MDRVGDRREKMERYCATGRSPQWAVVPMEEEEEEDITKHFWLRSSRVSSKPIFFVLAELNLITFFNFRTEKK